MLAYVFFALATRALGPEEAAPLSVLWTWWSLAAAALTFPLQHWTTRTVAAHEGEGAVRRDLPRVLLVVLAAALASGLLTWYGREELFGRHDLAFPALVLVVTAGSGVVGVVRGVLVARRRLPAVAATLVLENLVRVLLSAGLVLTGDPGALAFGLALVAGQLMVLTWPSTWRLGREGADLDHGAWAGFLGSASAGQLLAQAVLNGGPAVLALVGGAPGEVTALFAALALFRAPYTLALGAVAPVTGRLTRHVVAGDAAALRAYRVAAIALTAAATAVAVPVGLLAGPGLVRLVFGSGVDVDGRVAALIAAGSAVALGTLALSLLTLARGSAGRMLLAWLAAVAVGAVVLGMSPSDAVTDVAAAFLAAELVALGCLTPQRPLSSARLSRRPRGSGPAT